MAKKRVYIQKKKLKQVGPGLAYAIIDEASERVNEGYGDAIKAIRGVTKQMTGRVPTDALIAHMARSERWALDSSELEQIGLTWGQYYGQQ